MNRGAFFTREAMDQATLMMLRNYVRNVVEGSGFPPPMLRRVDVEHHINEMRLYVHFVFADGHIPARMAFSITEDRLYGRYPYPIVNAEFPGLMERMYFEEGQRHIVDVRLREHRTRDFFEDTMWANTTITYDDFLAPGRARQEADDWRREAERNTERAQADRARNRREAWDAMRQWNGVRWEMDIARRAAARPSASPSPDREAAKKRGMQLLWRNLTPAQRADMLSNGYFDVIGGKSGDTYRVYFGAHVNVLRMKTLKNMFGWIQNMDQGLCFTLSGGLVEGDVMLSQKLTIELEEDEIGRIANKFPINRDDRDFAAKDHIRLWRPYVEGLNV